MTDYQQIANNWETYDYEKAVFNDVKDVLLEDMPRIVEDSEAEEIEDIRDTANDMMWDDDNVTGNGSGSYTFSRIMAELFLIGNSGLYEEALEEFGDKFDPEPERRDVTIRCYLLPSTIDKALEDEEVIKAFKDAKAG